MASDIFDYQQVIMVGAQLEVPDLGDTAILGRDDLGQEYYLITNTKLGITDILEYGPALPDFAALPKSVKYQYDRIDYSEFKISKRIEKFLTGHPITFAEVLSFEELREHFRNPIDYIERD